MKMYKISIKSWSLGCNEYRFSICSFNGLAPARLQANVWVDVVKFTDKYMRQSASKSWLDYMCTASSNLVWNEDKRMSPYSPCQPLAFLIGDFANHWS